MYNRLTTFLFPKFKPPNVCRELCAATGPEEKLQQNPFYEKYAAKITVAQISSKNVTSKDNYLLEKDKELKMKLPSKFGTENVKPLFPGQKNLNQFMKVELLESKSAQDIETIWNQYHKERSGLYAVIPDKFFTEMQSRFKKYPTFVFPLPRAQGYEFIMCQYLDHTCYFTSLLNYQTFKENAPVCLTINFFLELRNAKGIVLMRGELDENALKIHEAQCLANQFQLYYGGNDVKKEKYLWTFNRQPESFRHMDLLQDFEYGLGK